MASCAGLTKSESGAKLAQSCQSAPTTLITGTTELSSTRDVGQQTSDTDVMRRATVTETVWALTDRDAQQAPTPAPSVADTDTSLRSTSSATSASATEKTSVVESHLVDDFSTAVQLVDASVPLVAGCLSADADEHQCSEITVTKHAATVSAATEDEDASNVDEILHPSEPGICASAVDLASIIKSHSVDDLSTTVHFVAVSEGDGERRKVTIRKHKTDNATTSSAKEKNAQHAPTRTGAVDEDTAAATNTKKIPHPTAPTTSLAATEMLQSSCTLIPVCLCRGAENRRNKVARKVTYYCTVVTEVDSAATEADVQPAPTRTSGEDKDTVAVSDTAKLLPSTEPATSATEMKIASIVSSHSLVDLLPPVHLSHTLLAVTADTDTEDQRSKVIITKYGDDNTRTASVTEDTQQPPTLASTEDDDEPATYASATEIASIVSSHQLVDLSPTVHLSHTLLAVAADTDTEDQRSKVIITKYGDDNALAVTEDTQHPPTLASTENEPKTSASATETASVVSSRVLDDAVSRDAAAEDQRSKVISTKRVADDKEETLLATLNRKMTADKFEDVTDRSPPSATVVKVQRILLRLVFDI